MTLLRKQSGTGCSVSWECHGADQPYDYRDDPFYQLLGRLVRRGRRALNKDGRNKRLRARRANDLDFRDRERARRYGITLEQLREMQVRQNNACAICRRTDCELVLDHDHVTGELRGLLCIPCNLILGLLRDDPRIARAAAEYLEWARSKNSVGWVERSETHHLAPPGGTVIAGLHTAIHPSSLSASCEEDGPPNSGLPEFGI
jgi:Recombination endonuclease VII